ncbi:MAG: hypothetical protein QM661_13360 [Solimonas sp.]
MSEQKKPTDDVQQLLSGLSLGDLQYREFSAPNAAKLKLASRKPQAPAVNLPADAAAVPSKAGPSAEWPAVPPLVVSPATNSIPTVVPASPPQRPVAIPANVPTLVAAPRAAVHESPLNFTFERLRRQAIAQRAHHPLITLDLPPRARVALPARLDRLQQRALSEVFSSLTPRATVKRQTS